MRKLLVALAIFAFGIPAVYSQTDSIKFEPAVKEITPEYRAATKNLFHIFGYYRDFQDMLTGLLKRIEARQPDLPQSFKDSLIKSVDNSAYIEEQIQLYAKFFTLDEVNKLAKFYETPVAKKMESSSKVIMPQVEYIQDKYYSIICEDLAKKIENRGFEAPAFMKPRPVIPDDNEELPNSNK